jgi:hypothetical protein
MPGQSGNPNGRSKGLARFIRESTRDGQEIAEFFLKAFRGNFRKLSKFNTLQLILSRQRQSLFLTIKPLCNVGNFFNSQVLYGITFNSM